jgi:hypothetical protein
LKWVWHLGELAVDAQGMTVDLRYVDIAFEKGEDKWEEGQLHVTKVIEEVRYQP